VFKNTISVANQVAIGATALITARNLCDAINASPASAGTGFASTTVANAYVVATINSGFTVVTVSAKTHGTGGNSYTLAESATNVVVSGANLSGGLASNYASTTELRYNSHTLKHQKITLVSEEIRSDRSAVGLVKVGIGAGGEFTHELIYGDEESFIASAMMTPIASPYTGANSATTWAIASNVLSTSGSLPAGLQAAKWIKLSGFATAANNGIKRVISSTSTTITLEGMTNEAAGATVTVYWRYSRQGTTLESYLIETEQADSGICIPLTGMCVNTWNLSMEARAKIMSTFGFIGYGLPSGTSSRTDGVGTTVSAASLNSVMNTTSNVAVLKADNRNMEASIRSLTLNVNNNLRERLAIGREGTLVPGTGESTITGTMQLYFDSKTQYDAFLLHTSQSLELTMQDAAGNTISIYLPKIEQTDGSYDVPGLNQDVFFNMNFKASKGTGHDTTQFQAQVDMLAA
jgi:hypothetical protein